MARVERFTATEPIPVERAQLIDPSAFRFSTAGAEAFKAIGGVLEELGKRKQKSQDSLSINATGESRDLAKLQVKQFMLDNPDPDKWAEGINKILGDQRKIYSEQRFSAEAKANEDIEQEAFENELQASMQILTATQTIENDITVSGKNLIDKIANDDGSTTAAADIDKQIKLYQAALERKDTKEVAAIKMEETLGQAEKQRIAVLINQGKFDEARELTSKTKSLTPTERNAQLSIIERAEKRAETSRKLLREQKDDEISEEFLGLLINKLDPSNPQLTFGMIETSNLSVDAKEKWFAKLRVFDNYSEGELKEAFTDKGEVLADIYDKIDNGTLTDELDTMVGRGLSPITAQRIKKEIRVPYEKDAEQFFKRIFGWSPELGFENELSSFLYEKTLREWQAEIKKQDATGEKIIEIGRSIARPYFLEHLKAVMPSDTNITRMMELALGEETKEVKLTEPAEVEEPEVEEEIKGIPEPKTQVEYDALPSGTIYIDTDGTRRRKK